MEREPIVIRRGAIGQWASFIGGIALLVGALSFLFQRGLSDLSIGAFIVGGISTAIWAFITPQDFRNFITGRQVRYSTSAVFSTLLLIGIVGMVYIFLQREVITVDMTEGRRFSLSPQSLDVLDDVMRAPRDIQLTGFYTRQDLRQREVDDQFFRLYEDATDGKIRRVYIDPDIQPGIAQKFIERYGTIESGFNLFLSFVNEDGTLDMESTIRVPRSESQERDLTESISRLLIAGEFKVYFTIGQGQYDPLDTTQQGLSGIEAGIRESGLVTAPLDLAALAQNGAGIPADASAVLIIHRTEPMTEAEIAMIDEYMQRGGAIFIMTDPLLAENSFLREESAFNNYLWERFGLKALDAVMVDPASSGQTPLDIMSATVYFDNDIGKRLNIQDDPDSRTLFRIARPILLDENPPVNNGRVIDTSPYSFAEMDLRAVFETNTYQYDENIDIPGTQTTVAWAYDQNTGAKVLIVGDSDFVTNGQVTATLGNALLFTDGLAWLTGFGERVSFGVQAFSTGLPILQADGPTLDAIALLTIVIIPGTVLIMGLAIWFRRARR